MDIVENSSILTGSVGVKQAEIHNAETYVRPGKSHIMKPAETAHPKAIVGTTIIVKLFQWHAK